MGFIAVFLLLTNRFFYKSAVRSPGNLKMQKYLELQILKIDETFPVCLNFKKYSGSSLTLINKLFMETFTKIRGV